MGRWTLTALVINSIIGSGIFGLPSIVAGYLGRRSPLAYLIAAAGIAVILACFAELASQFGASGGPYLYTREAFGRFVGVEVGWLQWAIKVTAAAAAAIVFEDYLVEFWPAAREPAVRLAVLTLLVGVLAATNIRGIKSGALANNFFTVAKLAPLFFFAIGGVVFILRRHPVVAAIPRPVASFPARNWFEAVILLTFPFGGFEGAVVPMAEVKNVRRDAPFALFVGLATVAAVYCAIQLVVVSVLPNPALSDRPLADAARQMWGPAGASLMSLGALVSVYGFLTALMLHMPRLMLALGEKGDFPRVLARIHPRFRTPHVSTLAFAVVIWCLAAVGTFQGNVLLSSVGRLLVYGFTCAALPVLRRKKPHAPSYRLPAGNLVAAVGVFLVALLASRLTHVEALAFLVAVLLAVASWVWSRFARFDASRSYRHQDR